MHNILSMYLELEKFNISKEIKISFGAVAVAVAVQQVSRPEFRIQLSTVSSFLLFLVSSIKEYSVHLRLSNIHSRT